MALGRYNRVDNNNNKSSSYCSTVTIVIFMGLCLVGIWMITSSWVVPVQNGDDPAEEKKNQLKDQVETVIVDSNDRDNKPQFEDKPNDLRKDGPEKNLDVSLAKDKGKANLAAEENQEKTEEAKWDKSKKDNQQFNSVGGEKNVYNSENLGGQGSESNNEKPHSIKDDKKSGSDYAEKKGDESTSRTYGDKVDKNDDKVSDKRSADQVKKKSSNEDSPKGDKVFDKSFVDQVKKRSNEVFPKGDKVDKNNDNGFDKSSDSQVKKSSNEDAPKEDKVFDKSFDDQVKKRSNEVFPKGDKVDKNNDNVFDKSSDSQVKKSSNEVFPSVAQSELLNETMIQNGSFTTQAAESNKEKNAESSSNSSSKDYSWKLCNSTAGPDFIPCLDNCEAIRNLPTNIHYEHRERHCPEVPPTCLVPLPEGYKFPIEWPKSRDKIWYKNVPHSKLVEFKGGQNWLKITGDYLTFPGGGTQFRRGALHYIDFIQQAVPDIAWGKRSRVILDVGCGVASFGGYLFERNVLAMSLAPKDEHEAQVQFALERGIPAVSAVMGTKRLPYPGTVFDIIHCARCRVPWHIEGGKLLLELNRLLRPGGFFLWSATPVYQLKAQDVEIWKAMIEQTKAMCWELVNKTSKEPINKVAIATFRKPTSNECYEQRSQQEPPLCPESDDPNAAWNVPLQTCMHKVPLDPSERGSKWPEEWPARLEKSPYWLLSSQVGVYGKAAPEDLAADNEHWKQVVTKSYMQGMGINWSSIRNVMDMKAVYGGFAAALKDMNLWVMNVIPVDSPDTLPIIYERGLFGIYHDWCESFSTYPRSYDLLHADHIFSRVKKRCNFVAVVAEVDRILRPGGKLIARDDVETITELENMVRSMHWEVRLSYSKDKEGLLCVQKSMWRPTEVETLTYAIA
ncbi:probable methyltransferase PMT26 isoform X2 [Gossypium hirsutum]|uniref:Probable methyltransferase PMT26 isoform X2 n=1 Tax=Gossypium hirsutum TaxID=3635 RepID=A0ABM3B3G9_GOSHI|nr:probable methyltransferase PMT26 isoform X2 [Gossypium hirsutum]